MAETTIDHEHEAPEEDGHHRAKHRREGADGKLVLKHVEAAMVEVDNELLGAQGDETLQAAQELLRQAKAEGDQMDVLTARDALIAMLSEQQVQAVRDTIKSLESDDYLVRAPGDERVKEAQAKFAEARLTGDPATMDEARENIYRAMSVEVEAAGQPGAAHAPAAEVPEAQAADPDGKYGFSKRDPALYRNPAGKGNPTTEFQRAHNKLYKAGRHAKDEDPDKSWGDPAVDAEAKQWRENFEAGHTVDVDGLRKEGDQLVDEAAAFVPEHSDSRAKDMYDAAVDKAKDRVHPAEMHHEDPGVEPPQGELQEMQPEAQKPGPLPNPQRAPEGYFPEETGVETHGQQRRFDHVAEGTRPTHGAEQLISSDEERSRVSRAFHGRNAAGLQPEAPGGDLPRQQVVDAVTERPVGEQQPAPAAPEQPVSTAPVESDLPQRARGTSALGRQSSPEVRRPELSGQDFARIRDSLAAEKAAAAPQPEAPDQHLGPAQPEAPQPEARRQPGPFESRAQSVIQAMDPTHPGRPENPDEEPGDPDNIVPGMGAHRRPGFLTRLRNSWRNRSR